MINRFKCFYSACFLFLAVSLNAKLLDKIVTVIDDDIYTLSDIRTIQGNYSARNEISPLLYKKTVTSDHEIIDHLINNKLIKSKLEEMRIIITPGMVDQIIKETQTRIGATKEMLLHFLKQKNVSMKQYGNILKESREFIIFIEKYIRPTISISEHQLKNAFYKKNSDNKTLSFKYSLVDFSIDKEKLNTASLKSQFKTAIKRLQTGESLPDIFSTSSTNLLGEMSAEGLDLNLKNELKKTEEGKFTSPILLGDSFHIFFVKKKDLVESELYLEAKNQIHNELFQNQVKSVLKIWLARERSKHYIKVLI